VNKCPTAGFLNPGPLKDFTFTQKQKRFQNICLFTVVATTQPSSENKASNPGVEESWKPGRPGD
jgi:hypothetical protein